MVPSLASMPVEVYCDMDTDGESVVLANTAQAPVPPLARWELVDNPYKEKRVTLIQ